MAKQSFNLIAKLSDAQTRTFVLLFGVIIIVGLAIAVMRHKSKPEDALASQGSEAVAIPSSIKATPGNVVSEKYRELQVQENEKRAQEALQKKSSAMPTIIGAISDTNDKGNADALALENALKNQQAKSQFGQATAGGLLGGGGLSDRERERLALEARLKEQRDKLEKQREDQERARELERQRQLLLQQQKEYEAAVQKISGQMKNYLASAYDDWSKLPKQQYVQGMLADKKFPSQPVMVTKDGVAVSKDGKLTRAGKEINPTKRRVFIKAGSILFGVMDTAVNSDEPGPVLATVVSTKYAGGKLIGSFQHQAQQEAVIITFTQMSLPKKLKSFSVNAIAIDPDTARTALATDVDRHILMRYGSLFASSFIQGYGQAVAQQGGTTTTSPLTGTTTTSSPPLDNKQIFMVALGQLGQQWSSAIKPYFTTPYTVTVDQGTSVGLLFLSDVEVPEDEG